MLAAGIVLAVILPRLFSGRSVAARWALVAGSIAALAANPTDFGYLVMILIGWVGLAMPNDAAVLARDSLSGQRVAIEMGNRSVWADCGNCQCVNAAGQCAI